MEKIIRRDTISDVVDLVDEHILRYDNLIGKAIDGKRLAELLDCDESEFDDEIQGYAGAIACLILLKKDLRELKDYD